MDDSFDALTRSSQLSTLLTFQMVSGRWKKTERKIAFINDRLTPVVGHAYGTDQFSGHISLNDGAHTKGPTLANLHGTLG